MGGAASIDLPSEVTLSQFQEIAGDRFSQDLFDEYKDQHGCLSKEQLLYLNQLTDCFLTHDWGTDELGRSNHERVARVNTSLKERGFVTWFDSEKMVGNILAQMCNGIDHTRCIITFITKNYVEKVSGNNANDNCQLEFNYAVRQKSAKFMIPVVMESRMRATSQWRGAVGMALGGSLYIDLADDHNWDKQIDELARYMLNIIKPIRKSVQTSPWAVTSQVLPTPVAQSPLPSSNTFNFTNYKQLEKLSATEVLVLLQNLNLSHFMIEFQKKGVDGATLAFVHSEQELVDLGIAVIPKARMLYTKLLEFKARGVELELITPSTAPSHDNNSANTPIHHVEHNVVQTPDHTHIPASPASVIALASKSQDLSHSSASVARSSFKLNPPNYQPPSADNAESPHVRRLTIRGITGQLEKRLNGVYYLHEFSNEDNIHHPVYRKETDLDIWLEYLSDKRCWQIKSTSSRKTKNCLAELSCLPSKNVYEEKEKSWMVFDGKTGFVEQAGVTVLPYCDLVVVYGVQGKLGSKLNGKYAESDEAYDGKPVFAKVGDKDMCIEYNSSRSRWQVKTTAGRKSNSCLAEHSDTVASNNSSPADVISVWLVCIDHKFEPHPTMHITGEWPLLKLHSKISTGKTSNAIQGVYLPYLELCGGQMVYRRRDRVDIWLEHSEQRGRWQVKPTKARYTSSFVAELKPTPDDANAYEHESNNIPHFTGLWEVSEEQIVSAPDLHLFPLFHPVFVSFRSLVFSGEHFDLFLTHCSGSFVPLERPFKRYPIYKHNSHAHYLQYSDVSHSWQLCSSSHTSASEAIELIPVFQLKCTGPIESCSGVWNILQKELHDSKDSTVEGRVLANPTTVHLFDATGSRSASINGLYDPTNEQHDHMLVYKRRETVSEAEGGNIWIEYSAAMKTWQLKRTADRGSPKAYATLHSLSPLPLQDSALYEKWSVFDVEQKQWLPQPQLKCWVMFHSVLIAGASGSHGESINGQYDPTDSTFYDMPLYKKKASEMNIWLEFNASLHCWQVKGDKDRGQNKAWAYLNTSAVLRPEECTGVWEVFDADLKWHAQNDLHIIAIVP